MEVEEDRHPSRLALSRLTGEQATVIATVLAFTFVLVRVIAVSKLNRETALALVSAAGVPSVVLGALISAIPILFFVLVYAVVDAPASFIGTPRRRLIGLLIGVVALAPLVPVTHIALLMVLLGPEVLRGLRRPVQRAPLNAPLRTTLIAFAAALSLVLTTRPWLPLEEIRISSGEVALGYVVADGERWTSVLLESDRTIVRHPSGSVIARSVCVYPADDESPTVFELAGLARETRACGPTRSPAPRPSPSVSPT